MNWDDLRYVLALSKAGSLARAALQLGVDHTTVGRRVEAAEQALGVRLFTRTTTGYTLTADAVRLLAPMREVEDAVLAVQRHAQAHDKALEGPLRVTSPETFGVMYLAPRLAAFGVEHPGLTIELMPSGELLDLGRREAEIAVRLVRSKQDSLVARRAGEVTYGLYASALYLSKRPVKSRESLVEHPLLISPEIKAIETQWVRHLNPHARAAFVSTSSLALLAAARASAGLAVLPRYLADADESLRHVPMPEEPSEVVWLTVHRDLARTPRIRAVLDEIAASMKRDALVLKGAVAPLDPGSRR